MAIFKRGRVYWYHFVFNGTHVQESTNQGNPRVARQMEAAHRTSLAKGEVGIREKKPVPTLAEFCKGRVEPWAKATFERTSINTWRWYRAGLRSIYAYPKLANLKLDTIGSEACVDFGAQRESQNLQVASVNASLRVLRRVLKLAAEWGVIDSVPRIRLLRGERHRERVISSQEEARYLAAAPDPLASIVTVLADTGMRPDECYRMRWEDVTFSGGKFGVVLVKTGKTAAARRALPLSPRVRLTLETRWEAAKRPQEGWIWPAPTKSGHMDHSSVKKQHARTFKNVNSKISDKRQELKPFVLYALRHTFLTRLAESGCDAWTLAKIAGHTSISISSRYVHPSADAVLGALSRLPLPDLLGEAEETGEEAAAMKAAATIHATVTPEREGEVVLNG
jgi:integrase